MWEYYNDNDCKEFYVGSLDFMKGLVVFCFVLFFISLYNSCLLTT